MPRRRLSLLQAVSLNMSLMVGIGPFITIPVLLNTMAGPQALLGWALGAALAVADGLVWGELAAAFPGSGGTYHFFDAVYGRRLTGRLLRFLFVWQFLISGPLEIASGAIGLTQHVGFVWPRLNGLAWRVPLGKGLAWDVTEAQRLAVVVLAGITALAYRRIEAAGRLMLVLWVGMLATVALVIVAGFAHFDPALAFDFPPGAFTPNARFAFGLGAAVGVAMYDFFGYYQVCYLGDEVEDAPRTIPRSILISVVAVALIYSLMNLAVIGVLPWREVLHSSHVGSDLIGRLYGRGAAVGVTWLIVWTAAASCFAAVLGASRVPYAAARAGDFFAGLAATHRKGEFPHRALVLVGVLSAVACFATLDTVIFALLASRIIVQFVGQAATVIYIRRRPELNARLRFRMPLYPLPVVLALAGWLYVLGTLEPRFIVFGVASIVVGAAVFFAWDRGRG